MRILYHELRKIWRPPVVLAIAVLGGLFYLGFMHSILFDGVLRSHPVAERYQIAREWAARYGTHMDEAEYAEAKSEVDALRRETAALLAADQALAAHGVADLASLDRLLHTEQNPEMTALLNSFQEASRFALFRIQEMESALQNYRGWYEYYAEAGALAQLTAAERARLREVMAERKLDGIFSGLDGTLSGYRLWWNLFAVLSVALLLAPCGAREHLNHMPAEQWPTHTGRRLVYCRWAAALLSAGGLFVLETLLFGGVYAAAVRTWMFWDNPVTSFIMGDVLWFDLTYGEYALAGLGMTLGLMLGTAGMAFTFSCSSGSYIASLLKTSLPAFLCAAAGGFAADSPFTAENTLYQHIRVMGIEVIICAALCAAGLTAGLLPLYTERRKELL